MKKRTLLTALLISLTMIFGAKNIKAEGIAPENVINTYFVDNAEDVTGSGSNVAIQSVMNWLSTESNWLSYGSYYYCEFSRGQSLQYCFFFDDYTQISYNTSYVNLFSFSGNRKRVSIYGNNNSPTGSVNVSSVASFNDTIAFMTQHKYYTNLKNYLLTGQLLNQDMNGYENHYWKYSLDYNDFIISIYDSERPEDVDTYPFDIFINAENYQDTRITIYNVLSNQFVAEFTEPNIEYEYDERFVGFSHELKEGEVIRITTTATESRDYYITNMYTQNQILISEVVNGEADYLNNAGITTPVSGIIDPPPRGMIVSVVEYQDYGDMNKLFGDVNSFISSTSDKAFLIFKPIGELFNNLNPTLRSAIISIFVLYLAGVVIVLLRRG